VNIHLYRYWIRQRALAQYQIDAIEVIPFPTPDDLRRRDWFLERLHHTERKLAEQ
jgi:hypothetical protein